MGIPLWTQSIKCLAVLILSFTAGVFTVGSFDHTAIDSALPDFISYKRKLRVTQGILAYLAIICPTANLFMFISSFGLKTTYGFVLHGCLDLIFGTLFLVCVGLQSTFLPHKISVCNNATTWNLEGPSWNRTSLFLTLEGTPPERVCHRYMYVWIFELTAGILLIINCLVIIEGARDPQSQDPPFHKFVSLLGTLSKFIPHPSRKEWYRGRFGSFASDKPGYEPKPSKIHWWGHIRLPGLSHLRPRKHRSESCEPVLTRKSFLSSSESSKSDLELRPVKDIDPEGLPSTTSDTSSDSATIFRVSKELYDDEKDVASVDTHTRSSLEISREIKEEV